MVVEHGRGEYVRSDVHVNAAEGFFSLLKRGIVGTFHHVSKAISDATLESLSFATTTARRSA